MKPCLLSMMHHFAWGCTKVSVPHSIWFKVNLFISLIHILLVILCLLYSPWYRVQELHICDSSNSRCTLSDLFVAEIIIIQFSYYEKCFGLRVKTHKNTGVEWVDTLWTDCSISTEETDGIIDNCNALLITMYRAKEMSFSQSIYTLIQIVVITFRLWSTTR